MKYRVVMFDNTNSPFATKKTCFNCESLEEAKLKKQELEKEHTNAYGELSCWFRFEIQEGITKTYTKTVWKEVL